MLNPPFLLKVPAMEKYKTHSFSSVALITWPDPSTQGTYAGHLLIGYAYALDWVLIFN